MSLEGKIYRIKSIIHKYRIKRKNKKGNIVFNCDLLDSQVKIRVCEGGTCLLGQIWGGEGIKIGIYGQGGFLKIDNDVCFGRNTFIDIQSGKVEIGSNCMFGPNIYITDHDHDYVSENWHDDYKCGEVYIGNNVWVGTNVVILKGTYIEDNCVIGAGMVLKGRYHRNTVYYNKQNIASKSFVRM